MTGEEGGAPELPLDRSSEGHWQARLRGAGNPADVSLAARLPHQRSDFQYALGSESDRPTGHAEGRHRPAGMVEDWDRHTAQPIHRKFDGHQRKLTGQLGSARHQGLTLIGGSWRRWSRAGFDSGNFSLSAGTARAFHTLQVLNRQTQVAALCRGVAENQSLLVLGWQIADG